MVVFRVKRKIKVFHLEYYSSGRKTPLTVVFESRGQLAAMSIKSNLQGMLVVLKVKIIKDLNGEEL